MKRTGNLDTALAGALSGQRAAGRILVEGLTPIIRARVRRVLRPRRGCFAQANQDVEDVTQDIWVVLLERRAHVLRAWRPETGMSLENFVGLVTERRAISIARRQQDRWRAEPLGCALDTAPIAPIEGPEGRAISREMLQAVVERMCAVSPRTVDLFHRLVVCEEGRVEPPSQDGMTRGAAYAWRSRLRRLARRFAGEIETGTPFVSGSALPATSRTCGSALPGRARG